MKVTVTMQCPRKELSRQSWGLRLRLRREPRVLIGETWG
jgi:hypothetical protein